MGNKKIFFSYGHDSTDKVLLIKRGLEQAGYTVWLDAEGITPGDDWRAKITEAILSCDCVVAFLSEHSLRKDSVCLNELAIAVSHKSNFIKTVLLSPSIEDKIPATISGIQYCDMGEWERYVALPEQEFKTWYDEKLLQIISAVEHSEDGARDFQLKYLERTLSPAKMSNRRNIELQKPFVNRAWMEHRVDQWLRQSDSSQYLLLYGGPGSGKSAFSAHYFHFDSRVVGSVFCEWGCRNFSNAAQIIKSIAFQMALKLSTYRMRLAGVIENCGRDLSAYDTYELFELLLLQPLYGDTVGDKTILVIIDGADEANRDGSNELAELLSAYAQRMPPFLKILITSRNDSIVQRYFSDCEEFHIDAHVTENTEDIYRLFKERIGDKLTQYPNWKKEQILRGLTEKSGNSFLYAELLVKSIQSKELRLDRMELMPKGLQGLYFNWMQRKFPDEQLYETEYQEALSLIAAANQLPIRMLGKAVNLKGARFKKFMRQMKTFLETEQNLSGEECVYFFHRSFAEWLCSENADIYELSVEEGIQALAETMYDSYENGELTDFETENLLDYLQRSGMTKQFHKVAQDYEYLHRLYELGRSYEGIAGGFQSAVQIYARLVSLLNETPQESPALTTLRYGALCGRGRSQFALGFYEDALETLVREQGNILKFCNREEAMQSLLIIGSAYDWKGEREHSVEAFNELLQLSHEGDLPQYTLRAYEGLIWNEHFNDMRKAANTLSVISALPLSKNDEMACNLCLARILLSEGKLPEALDKFDQCFSIYDFSQSEDFYAMKKSKMLMMEILPACFDNERYLDGVRCGLHIWQFVKNQGWLEECYCSSWIALSYMRLGDIDAAEEYLYHAQACNNTMSAAAKSSWMQMHLTSVEASLCFEKEQYQEAVKAHQKVLEMARACSDAWVLGDACFELLILHLLFLSTGSDEPVVADLVDALERTSAESELIHLRCKAAVIKAILSACAGDMNAVELIRTARTESNEYQLASMDPIMMRYIEYRIMDMVSPGDVGSAIAEIDAAIADTLARNQGSSRQTDERLFVQRVRKEVH